MNEEQKVATAKKWRRLRVLSADSVEVARQRDHVYISRNSKTGASINLPPATTCTNISPECARYCYSLVGPISMKSSVRTHVENELLLRALEALPQTAVDSEADYVAAELKERGLTFLRINGVGELVPGTVRLITALAKRHPWLSLWVATRKPELAAQLPTTNNCHIMFGIDRSTRPEHLAEMRALVRSGRGQVYLSYVQVDEQDVPPSDAAVVFIEHRGSNRGKWEPPFAACGATVHEAQPGFVAHDNACASCRRCFDLEKRAAFV